MAARILIIDSQQSDAEALRDELQGRGYETAVEADAAAGLQYAEQHYPSAIIVDNSDSKQANTLREIRAQLPDTPVIILARRSSIEIALRAIQQEGAYHYFEKPVDFESLIVVVDRAVEFAEARRENELLRRQLRGRGAFGELVGQSKPMQEVYALIEQVAPSSASVLITGESGTGKELVARTVHNLSPRRNGAFVAINCSAIPETLMESELFGHEKGAFTGAASRRVGCFELAHGGTLLLDEIAEMPPLLQAKLLRVVEERLVRRLGSRKEVPVDVRLLAATNQDPHRAVRQGTLREDLLY
ncbi:MAG: sigma-54 dependent transcriptional regulator, partial [Pyrinomonadaceae bacterium]